MKEDLLRGMIRKQIKSSLKEAPIARGQVTTTLGRVEKMAAVKMLKKALGQGGPQQQAAGLHAVVRAISGDSQQTARLLARLLMKKGIDTPDPGEVDPTPDVQAEAVSAQLKTRMAKVDKSQAFDMLKKALKTKPATQQADFIADLIKNLELKGNLTMLIKKIRQVN